MHPAYHLCPARLSLLATAGRPTQPAPTRQPLPHPSPSPDVVRRPLVQAAVEHAHVGRHGNVVGHHLGRRRHTRVVHTRQSVRYLAPSLTAACFSHQWCQATRTSKRLRALCGRT